jgi:nucleotide-binding universal stress UspA family protein
MFNNVLVGVDFESGGRDAIALASKLLDTDGLLRLVHAYPGASLPIHAAAPGVVREERERAEAQLAVERADARVEAELIVAEGVATGRVLHEEAEACGADLLALGSCRRGVVGRVMLGDDTRAALNGAPCAVAIAPAGYAAHPEPFASIGVGYDGSPESEAALRVARSLAGPTSAAIRALHVVSVSSYGFAGFGPVAVTQLTDFVTEADERMKALDGVEGRAELGLAVDDLAAFSKEVDLLVVGSRGYGPWGRLVHGSTSNQLAKHAGSPLLIVPRASRQAPAGTAGAASAQIATPA